MSEDKNVKKLPVCVTRFVFLGRYFPNVCISVQNVYNEEIAHTWSILVGGIAEWRSGHFFLGGIVILSARYGTSGSGIWTKINQNGGIRN